MFKIKVRSRFVADYANFALFLKFHCLTLGIYKNNAKLA